MSGFENTRPRRRRTSLAEIFHGNFYDAGSGRLVPWLIQCKYCGCRNFGESLEDAATEFCTHMYFGFDTSQAHWEFAAGGAR